MAWKATLNEFSNSFTERKKKKKKWYQSPKSIPYLKSVYQSYVKNVLKLYAIKVVVTSDSKNESKFG